MTSGGQLAWFDRSGKQLSTRGERGDFSDLHLSPDGRQVAVSRRESRSTTTTDLGRRGRGRGSAPPADIWLFDVASGLPAQFTFDPGAELGAIWSPDGKTVAFSSDQKGQLDLYQKPADGSGAATELLVDETGKTPLSCSVRPCSVV